jgi:hypothetical protein
MMKYIAHRALFNGPDPEKENHPIQILVALNAGWDCEIDVWWQDNQWWLGHDAPAYQVDENFLHRPGLWMHCKNLGALSRIPSLLTTYNPHYFWHGQDDYTLTSQGIIWTYPGKELTENSIWNQPEWDIDWRITVTKNVKCYGICSKYVDEISKKHTE